MSFVAPGRERIGYVASRPRPRALRVGFGLLIGAGVSVGLWIAVARLVLTLLR